VAAASTMRPARPGAGGAAAALAALLLFNAGPARADEPPALRQGLWQFERSIGGQKLVAQECVNPTEAMRRQNAVLEKSGCKFSPGKRAGQTYTFAADCVLKPQGSEAVSVRSTSVMTVADDGAYKVEITTSGAGMTTQELLVARRLGDCSK
jgi:hypothetical protein